MHPDCDPVIVDQGFVPINNQDDFDIGEATREDAIKLLAGKRPGTFLLRFNRDRKKLAISRKVKIR